MIMIVEPEIAWHAIHTCIAKVSRSMSVRKLAASQLREVYRQKAGFEYFCNTTHKFHSFSVAFFSRLFNIFLGLSKIKIQ